MFFQILPRVDIQPRVLFPASDPLPVSAAPIPVQPAPPLFPQAEQQKLGEELEHQVGGQIDTFIKAVQSRPILYKSRASGITNGEKKKAWNEISKVMKVPAEQCQIKWKALRDVYVKKKRVEENENPKGVSRKKWPFMQAMSFIDPFLRRYMINSNLTAFPTDANSTCPNGNLTLTEGNGDVFILGSDSGATQPSEENSNNGTVTVKLEPSSDDQSQEIVFDESVVPPIQSPSTSCEKEDSCMDPSSVMEELLRCPKSRKSRKRKAVDPEDILEVAITKLLNEPAPPPDDYLDHRTKALCCLIRERNFDAFDQFEVLKQCEEIVLNYKKSS